MARNRAQVAVNGESDKLAVPDKSPRDIGQLAEFIVAQTAKSRAEVFDALPEIVKALAQRAKTGDTRAASLVLAFVSETLSAPAVRATSKPAPALAEAMSWLPKGGTSINDKAPVVRGTNGEGAKCPESVHDTVAPHDPSTVVK